MQKVNPAVPLPKIIPDADSLKLLDTIIGEVAYRSDTNLIVWGTLKLYRPSLSLGYANSYMIYLSDLL